MLLYIVIGGVVLIVVVAIATRPSAPASHLQKGAKVTDNDGCEHTVDQNGFITCTGGDCTGKQKCTLQRRLVGKDPWKDVDPATTDNNVKDTRYEFRCICK